MGGVIEMGGVLEIRQRKYEVWPIIMKSTTYITKLSHTFIKPKNIEPR